MESFLLTAIKTAAAGATIKIPAAIKLPSIPTAEFDAASEETTVFRRM
tara:strand:- start:30701 stop:30844 length:144 start_codon:yes stop_codon:yes gene_type:complete